MAKSAIEKKIDNKLKSISKQIAKLESEKLKWEKVASNYETNRETLESILSLHDAPDLAEGDNGEKTEKRVSKKGGFSVGN
jgi:predicted ribosome quality control (RQC) complex YloA/Tae2 family protein